MAENEETNEEETTEETNEEEESNEEPSNWDKMGNLVRGIVREELKAWRAPAAQSKNSEKPQGQQQSSSRTQQKKPGFLTDWFKNGLK